VIGVRAARGRRGHAEHLVADPDTRHVVADLVHHARGVEPGPVRERHGHHITHLPGADVRLSRRQSGRPYSDADRPRPCMRLLDLGDMHHAGRAILGKLNSSHAPQRNGTPRPFD
jgi:hypothetical protein